MVDNTPFFIIGAGRSGTTLLRLILTGHTRLHIPPETRFIRPLVEDLPLADVLTPAQVDHAVNLMTDDYRWPDMDIAANELRDQALALRRPKLVDIINLVFRRHLANFGKPRIGDKTPIYFEIVPQLSTLYPGSKFIHLIRDGRDVAISRINVGWERYYEKDCFEWTQAMRFRRKCRNFTNAQQIYEVKYEDLVYDPEITVRRICDFLGEEFEPAMLNWQSRTDIIPIREQHIHTKLMQPISINAIAGWRTRLNIVESLAMEACLYRDLLCAGYTLRFANIAWRPALGIIACFLHILAPALRRVIPSLQRRGYLSTSIYF